MENFTPIASTIGGLLIGLASAMLLLFNGRIAGISGITGGLLSRAPGDTLWRGAFIGGLVVGGAVMAVIDPSLFHMGLDRPTWAVALAGLLVGFGTQLGNGCTSGHGVCGISRFSRRSILATLTFIGTGVITVYVVEHVIGGVA